MLLENQVAIITGAASGIGKATAERMAEEGAAVVVADINKPGADQVAEAIRQSGGKAMSFEVDISQEDQVKALVAFAIARFGSLTILHNNAGPVTLLATKDRDLINLDADMWDRAMAVALRGPMLCCKHAVPAMIRQGGGAIINTASVAGKLGGHYLITHQSSKGGLLALTRAVATRHGKDGIRCNAILPGFVATPAYDKMPKATGDTILRHTMSKRSGIPDDVAYLVVFLASERAAYINGVEIPVDGGYSCHEPATADFQAMEAVRT
jgi:NAD(P)-dependent dehydrogenase (short-subunit alcohol dehydrogenase family)